MCGYENIVGWQEACARATLGSVLVAWLQSSVALDLETRAAHIAYRPSFEARVVARGYLATVRGADKLVALERPPAAGEGLEPAAFV